MAEPAAEQIDTTNLYAVHTGTNMDTSSWATVDRAKWVAIGSSTRVVCRTKQEAYRLAAWLVVLAEESDLPDEDGAHSLDDVIASVEATRG